MQSFKKLPFFLFLIIGVTPMIINTLNSKSSDQIVSILSPLSTAKTVALAAENIVRNPLADITENLLINDHETYGVYIKNLKTGETYGYNQNLKFVTASLYKLWIMGAVFEKISKGQLSYSATNQDLLEKMITVSDNDAADTLITKTGNSYINNFLLDNGFFNSSFDSAPSSTPEDIGLFFDKLYKGEIIDSKYSTQMMDILKRQKINNRLPKYLPEDIVIAHKTGDLDNYKNDAGVVFTKNGDYIIVVMSNTKDPEIAIEKIAKYSEAVYNYFSSQ